MGDDRNPTETGEGSEGVSGGVLQLHVSGPDRFMVHDDPGPRWCTGEQLSQGDRGAVGVLRQPEEGVVADQVVLGARPRHTPLAPDTLPVAVDDVQSGRSGPCAPAPLLTLGRIRNLVS